ncbi:unnamed product [Ostreococcus tauri]|uniref:Unnamed product n=2 Tax=Ostreococcus tauri TaxID=70448 RepID=A0A096PAJ9_OSTTA|nr:unnamed product [Ostreococcus tauri]CEG01752.1 unnamed product [Ostreococcus tauri]|eukprot:XP_003083276.2 unnamed product [Ostreococcus tauri]
MRTFRKSRKAASRASNAGRLRMATGRSESETRRRQASRTLALAPWSAHALIVSVAWTMAVTSWVTLTFSGSASTAAEAEASSSLDTTESPLRGSCRLGLIVAELSVPAPVVVRGDDGRLAKDLAFALTDELCGLEITLDRAWFVREHHKLALALRGAVDKVDMPFECHSH